MNPLDQYPSLRKVAYFLQWITTLATGVLGVVFTAREAAVPEWYTVTVAVLAFVWSYTGLTAQTNVDAPKHRASLYQREVAQDDPAMWVDTTKPKHDERGAIDVGTAVVIALLVVVVILIAKDVLR